VVSIIPRPGADDALMNLLRTFKRMFPLLSSEDLVNIIEDANQAMGLRATADETELNLPKDHHRLSALFK
jgi:hypothetical protein